VRNQVLGAGQPGVERPVHAEVMDPVGRARAVDDDGIPHVQPRDAVYVKATGTNRHVVVREVVFGAGDRELGKIVPAAPAGASRDGAFELHETVDVGVERVIAPGGPGGAQDGSGGTRALAAEDDAAGADADLAGDAILARLQQDGTPETVRVHGQLR